MLGDHLGSASVTYDGTNDLHQGYMPWGETRFGGLPTRYQFTGQYREPDLGLDFFNARWYDSRLGRFVEADSIIPEASQGTQAWDRYAYTNNNPVNGVDPSGHFTVIIGAAIGAIVGVAIVAATHPNLQRSDYIQAAMVGAAAGALIGTGVGIGAGTALGATLVGAGVGAATSAAGYAVTAGDCQQA